MKVLFQGSFEIIHSAHIRALAFAKSYGDTLIVALNTDELLKSYKNRVAVLPWAEKKEILEAIKYVDKVVPAPDFSPLKLLKKYDIDVYIVADEWENTKAEEIAYMYQKDGLVVTAPRFGTSSTTDIKKKLLQEYVDAQKTGIQPIHKLRGSRQAISGHGRRNLPTGKANKRATGTVR